MPNVPTPAPCAASCALAACDQGFASEAWLDEAALEAEELDADDPEEDDEPPEHATRAMKDAKQMQTSSAVSFLFIVPPFVACA